VFYPMHVMPPYLEEGAVYSGADLASARGINLPTHGMLSEQDIDRIVAALQHAID
jgi:perosamine synthetase